MLGQVFLGNKLAGDKGKIAGSQNFALNGTQGEVGVSLKNLFLFFLERLIFILSPHKHKLW